MSSEELIRESRRHPKIDDRGMMDVPFLVLVLLLVAIGLLMMFSASYVRANYETGNSLHFFIRQAGFAAVGLAAMFGASRFSCHIWQKLAKVIYAVSVLLLVAVLVVGVEAGGAKRWINLAGQQFQPSEVAKFSLICMMAAMAAQYKEKMADFRYGVVRMGGVMLLILALVALEKHLSAIMIIGIVSVVMMYVGGTKKRWLFLAMGLAVVFLVLYVSVMGYAGDRITAWLNPEADAQDKGYQVLQSQYAIGSGDYSAWALAWGGKKHLYLPEEHNDYIFAIVCEELGLIGAVGIIILFAPSHYPGLLDCHACRRPVFHHAGCGNYNASGSAGGAEYGGCEQPSAVYRRGLALLLLRRHQFDDEPGRNGHHAQYFPLELQHQGLGGMPFECDVYLRRDRWSHQSCHCSSQPAPGAKTGQPDSLRGRSGGNGVHPGAESRLPTGDFGPQEFPPGLQSQSHLAQSHRRLPHRSFSGEGPAAHPYLSAGCDCGYRRLC